MPRNRIAMVALSALLLTAGGAVELRGPSGPGAPGPPPPLTGSEDPKARALFSAVVARHGAFQDFRAHFTETAVSRATGAGAPETGVVFYKRPDRWRWEYTSPERKTVVVRDKVAVIAIEGDDEASRYELGEDESGSGIGSLLAGGKRIEEAFTARFEASASDPRDELATLRLDPATISEQYDHIVLRVHRRDLTIVEAVVVDPGGNSLRFQFEGFEPDRGLSESLFEPPRSKAPARGKG